MRARLPAKDKHDATVVHQVAEYVRAWIVRQRLHRGAPLPSYRVLARELDVAYWTVKRGISELAAEGVVHQQQGRGTFVNKELSRAPRTLQRLGVICPSSRTALFVNSYLTEIMQGAMVASPPAMRLTIFSLREDGLVNAAQLGEAVVDGVLLLNLENDDYLRAFARWGTPGVVLDYCPQDVPLDHVACDNAAAARVMVAHLAALGHRRVLLVAPTGQQVVASAIPPHKAVMMRQSSDVRERQEACMRELRAHDMAVEFRRTTELSGAFLEELRRRVRSGRGPTVVLGDSGYSATLVIDALAGVGLRVPDEISVSAVAGDLASSHRSPTVTHCRFDFSGMGQLGIRLLAEQCRQPEKGAFRGHRIGFQFVAGETVLPVSRSPRGRR